MRTRSRIVSCASSGTHTTVSWPARNSGANIISSRRSVLTLSLALRGISRRPESTTSLKCGDQSALPRLLKHQVSTIRFEHFLHDCQAEACAIAAFIEALATGHDG